MDVWYNLGKVYVVRVHVALFIVITNWCACIVWGMLLLFCGTYLLLFLVYLFCLEGSKGNLSDEFVYTVKRLQRLQKSFDLCLLTDQSLLVFFFHFFLSHFLLCISVLFYGFGRKKNIPVLNFVMCFSHSNVKMTSLVKL
jgi:hypothetical protein